MITVNIRSKYIDAVHNPPATMTFAVVPAKEEHIVDQLGNDYLVAEVYHYHNGVIKIEVV